MNNTASFGTYEKIPRLAKGYTFEGDEDNERALNSKSLPGRGSSAGGGYSTAGDMLRFTNALNAGKLRIDPGSKEFSGLGIAGGAPGINAVLEAEPEGYTIIVMANYDAPVAEDIGKFARKLFGSLAGAEELAADSHGNKED